MHHMSIVLRKDREKLEEELSELIKNPPQPESPYKELPNVYTEKENDDEWQPVDEEQHQRYWTFNAAHHPHYCYPFPSVCPKIYVQ